jgi:DNA end-binding protein Ku
MRAIWKGSISFGLIVIPIALYAAVRREQLKFRLLRRSDLSPVNYKRVAEADGKEVPWDEIVKGYEYEKGSFVVLKEEDFLRVDVEATQTVEIMDFVRVKEINPIFFNKPYYLEPQKGSDKAYVLLKEILRITGLAGIAKVVIKDRQHVACVRPYDGCLVLTLMHFADELVDPKQLRIPEGKEVTRKELLMAEKLVDTMTATWDPSRYQDEYRKALLKLIEQKVEAGGRDVSKEAAVKPRGKPIEITDLVKALDESLKRRRMDRRAGSPNRGSIHRKAGPKVSNERSMHDRHSARE